jgi:hypothetical protein
MSRGFSDLVDGFGVPRLWASTNRSDRRDPNRKLEGGSDLGLLNRWPEPVFLGSECESSSSQGSGFSTVGQGFWARVCGFPNRREEKRGRREETD